MPAFNKDDSSIRTARNTEQADRPAFFSDPGRGFSAAQGTGAGKLKTGLEESLLAGLEQAAPKTIDEFFESSPYLKDIVDNTNQMLDGINEAILGVTEGAKEDAVDVDALVGLLGESFELTKNRVLDAALVSSQKTTLELDAFLGSSSSDARAAVRRNIASSVTNQLITSTQQGIANLYSGYTDKIISTTLAGAQINAQARKDATAALVNLTQAGAGLMLGTNSAIMDSYVKSVTVANDALKVQAGLLTSIYGLEQSEAERRSKFALSVPRAGPVLSGGIAGAGAA